jgi:UDP-glucose:(heptosyl)LPS alpha-1,3-glucosyltransferase
MKLAFIIDKYFPFGGLQRDFYALISAAAARGDDVHVVTLSWKEKIPEGITVHYCNTRALTNHNRLKQLSNETRHLARQQNFDLIIGFKKIPGLDIYFMGEDCYFPRLKNKPWLRLFSRYRTFEKLEETVFSKKNQTRILYIDAHSKKEAITHYGTQESRFTLLPPGIERKALSREKHTSIRKQYRQEEAVNNKNYLLLFVGSNYALKGLSLAIEAIAKLPNELRHKIRLFVAGDDDATEFKTVAEKHQLTSQITFLGPRDDVSEWMAAADLLIHPTLGEPGGKVLLEALMNTLPVLTTKQCGYAKYIVEANAGDVISTPNVSTLAKHLEKILNTETLENYRRNAISYASSHQFNQFTEMFLSALDETLKAKKNNTGSGKRLTGQAFDTMMSLPGEIFRQVKERETLRAEINGKIIFIKKHFPISCTELIKNLLSLKLPVIGAIPECKAITALEKEGILVPRLYAYGKEGNFIFNERSFIAMHEVKYAFTLEQAIKKWSNTPPDFIFKRKLIKEVARIAKRMHSSGINHRDFYLCHFLFSGDEEIFKLTLIDLHRAQIRHAVPLRWQVKDLAGLFYSATGVGITKQDAFYFIKEYHQTSLKEALIHNKLLWEKVRLKMQKHLKKGRYPR